MSAWGDMMRRGAGEEIRTEDKQKFITLDKIEKILKEMKVGQNQGEYSPLHTFIVTVDGFDGQYVIYSITAAATQHPDGTRNFYSEQVLNSFRTLIDEKGYIVKISNY